MFVGKSILPFECLIFVFAIFFIPILPVFLLSKDRGLSFTIFTVISIGHTTEMIGVNNEKSESEKFDCLFHHVLV